MSQIKAKIILQFDLILPIEQGDLDSWLDDDGNSAPMTLEQQVEWMLDEIGLDEIVGVEGAKLIGVLRLAEVAE